MNYSDFKMCKFTMNYLLAVTELNRDGRNGKCNYKQLLINMQSKSEGFDLLFT